MMDVVNPTQMFYQDCARYYPPFVHSSRLLVSLRYLQQGQRLLATAQSCASRLLLLMLVWDVEPFRGLFSQTTRQVAVI